ncbi:hypothetical protein XAP6164_3090020 [Xanthomonas phaseoli pv. phaseoli]|nr:hypothetical protein XAP6164_3090020 [Xanthomonas phaseoli pv. phaseoli]
MLRGIRSPGRTGALTLTLLPRRRCRHRWPAAQGKRARRLGERGAADKVTNFPPPGDCGGYLMRCATAAPRSPPASGALRPSRLGPASIWAQKETLSPCGLRVPG